MGGVRSEPAGAGGGGGAVKQVRAKAARQTLRGIRGQARGADVNHFLGKTHRLAADFGEEGEGEA